MRSGWQARVTTVLTILAGTALFSSGCAAAIRPAEEILYSEDPGLPGLPTTDPVATRAYLATLTFASTPVLSTITCHNGPLNTIEVYPEVRSHHLDPKHAMVQGRIVAMIRNLGPGRCQDLYLNPGEVAYWWMGPNRGLALTTDFWRIPASSGDAIRHLANTGPTVAYRTTQRDRWDAELADTLRHKSDDGGDLAPAHFGHNSTWIACLGGCCESTTLTDSFF